ncbi:MAG: hypothetical protein K2M75_04160 [Clostridia bacterium]|nr:hypothetical protein [Clostridia bacterium]
MEKVRKQDLAMYSEKNSNVATIKSAFGVFSYAAVMSVAFLMGFFLFTLSLAIDSTIENQYNKEWNWEVVIWFGVALLAISVAAIVRLIIVRTPSIYFVGNEMYIKDGKDYYLKVLPEDIDEYSWNMCASRSYYSVKGNNYANSLYWGYLILIVGGVTYRLSCSSLKKTKHYLDGFMNGLSVNENAFDEDKLQQITRRICLGMPIIVSIVIFAAIMFSSASKVITAIAAILFSLSCILLVIGLIKLIKNSKTIRQLHKEYYDTFVTNKTVIIKKSKEDSN